MAKAVKKQRWKTVRKAKPKGKAGKAGRATGTKRHRAERKGSARPPRPAIARDPQPDAEPVTEKALWTAADLATFSDLEWVYPGLFPRKQVIMISGPKSSFKSYILLATGLSMVYGLPSWDKQAGPLQRGWFVYITGEDERRVGRRRIAWLRLHNLAEVGQDGFRVVNVKRNEYIKAEKGKGINGGPTDRLNILDDGVVEALIKDLKSACEKEGATINLLAIDTITSLLPKLTDEVCRPLIRALKKLAEALNCCVVIVNHTNRRNPRAHQGSYVLADSIDGDMICERDRHYMVADGEGKRRRQGLRAVLYVERLKDGDDDVTYEFVGTPFFLDRPDGRKEKLCAMECRGLTSTERGGSEYATRVLMATRLNPEHSGTVRKVNIAEVISLCGWKRGGSQYNDVRAAVPESAEADDEWTGVQLPVTGELCELRRYLHGKREVIECRQAVPVVPQRDETTPPKPGMSEVEIAAIVRMKKEKQARMKPLPFLRRGNCPRASFEDYMAQSVGQTERDRFPYSALQGYVTALRESGAEITAEGEQIIKLLISLSESPDTMGAASTIFVPTKTLREALVEGSRLLKLMQRRARAKAAAAKRKPKPDKGEDKPDDKPAA